MSIVLPKPGTEITESGTVADTTEAMTGAIGTITGTGDKDIGIVVMVTVINVNIGARAGMAGAITDGGTLVADVGKNINI